MSRTTHVNVNLSHLCVTKIVLVVWNITDISPTRRRIFFLVGSRGLCYGAEEHAEVCRNKDRTTAASPKRANTPQRREPLCRKYRTGSVSNSITSRTRQVVPNGELNKSSQLTFECLKIIIVILTLFQYLFIAHYSIVEPQSLNSGC